MLHDIGTGDGIVQTQDAQCPARGAQRFLQQAQQAPEIQWLQQAPAEADRCVVHIGARPFGSAYEHHGGKFRRHKSSWRARARWEDRKYDSNGPALGTACATAVAALTTEEAILRHSRAGSISRLSTCCSRFSSSAFSHLATTMVATPLPIRLVGVRPSDSNRCTPRISATLSTGIEPTEARRHSGRQVRPMNAFVVSGLVISAAPASSARRLIRPLTTKAFIFVTRIV